MNGGYLYFNYMDTQDAFTAKTSVLIASVPCLCIFVTLSSFVTSLYSKHVLDPLHVKKGACILNSKTYVTNVVSGVCVILFNSLR